MQILKRPGCATDQRYGMEFLEVVWMVLKSDFKERGQIHQREWTLFLLFEKMFKIPLETMNCQAVNEADMEELVKTNNIRS